jgi:hypothetical protein
MIVLLMMIAACNSRGCARETILLSPASCEADSFAEHHSYYDERVYVWKRRCPDRTEEGELRIGAVMFTDALGCLSAEGPCIPCLPQLHGTCHRTGRGLFSGFLPESGDTPLGAGYFLRCSDPEPAVAVFFQDQEDGPISSCVADALGSGRCDDECSLSLTRRPEPQP